MMMCILRAILISISAVCILANYEVEVEVARLNRYVGALWKKNLKKIGPNSFVLCINILESFIHFFAQHLAELAISLQN